MKDATKKVLEQIDEAHDWREGQTRSGGGTHYYRLDECRMCGLQRRYEDDSQNGVHEEWSFMDTRGGSLPFLGAASYGCQPVEADDGDDENDDAE